MVIEPSTGYVLTICFLLGKGALLSFMVKLNASDSLGFFPVLMIVFFQHKLSMVVKKLREPLDGEFSHGGCWCVSRHHVGIPCSGMHHWTTTGILSVDSYLGDHLCPGGAVTSSPWVVLLHWMGCSCLRSGGLLFIHLASPWVSQRYFLVSDGPREVSLSAWHKRSSLVGRNIKLWSLNLPGPSLVRKPLELSVELLDGRTNLPFVFPPNLPPSLSPFFLSFLFVY